jgi:hypothetical protein
MTDLWPNDLATVATKPPLTILKEQASLLGAKTKNIVGASVVRAVRTIDIVSAMNGVVKPFCYNFIITSPALGNYTYRLFVVSYDIGIYPVEFMVDRAIAQEILGDQADERNQRLIASDEQEFIEILSRILNSEKTRQVIRAILSHATDQTPENAGTPD